MPPVCRQLDPDQTSHPGLHCLVSPCAKHVVPAVFYYLRWMRNCPTLLPPRYRQQLSRGRSAVHWTRFTPISANRSMFCPVIRSSFTTSSYFVRHTWRLRLTTRCWTNNEKENLVYSVQSFMILSTSEKQRTDLVILRLTSTFSFPFYSSHRITSQLTSM